MLSFLFLFCQLPSANCLKIYVLFFLRWSFYELAWCFDEGVVQGYEPRS